MSYKYSFIIPHKNCPDLLQRCVASIPKRDDVQIIVVDDNSIEGKKPALPELKGLEIVLLDSSLSKGAGRARNVGLTKAEGEWLLFADADDYYEKENLDTLLKKYEDEVDTDIVYLNSRLFDENGVFRSHPIDQLIKDYLDSKAESEMHLRYSVWTPWTRMVRRRMVRKYEFEFEEVPAGNDKNFCLECSRHAEVIAVEPNIIYNYYRPHFQSQTDKNRNSKMLDAMIAVRAHTNQIYSEVRYNHQQSFLGLFHRSKYTRDLSFTIRLRKYFHTLKNYKVCLFTDLYRYIKEHRNKLIRK